MGRRAEQRGQAEDEQNERIGDLEQQQTAPPPASQEARAASSPMLDQLNQLAALHQQGTLTDDEFTTAKAKLLNG